MCEGVRKLFVLGGEVLMQTRISKTAATWAFVQRYLAVSAPRCKANEKLEWCWVIVCVAYSQLHECRLATSDELIEVVRRKLDNVGCPDAAERHNCRK